MTPPPQKPGRSEQVVQTPPEVIQAVKELLRIPGFRIDLAADNTNRQASVYISEREDALSMAWEDLGIGTGWAWLNPPFKRIAPWVEKAKESRQQIAMLVLASVGTNWWRDHVHGYADVLFLNGRPKFVGHGASIKFQDLALLLYPRNVMEPDPYKIWNWRTGDLR